MGGNPFVVLDRWLSWLDSHDGRLHRRGKGGAETDSDLIATIPNPPGAAIFTVGDLRAVVHALRREAARGRPAAEGKFVYEG